MENSFIAISPIFTLVKKVYSILSKDPKLEPHHWRCGSVSYLDTLFWWWWGVSKHSTEEAVDLF